jgi:uncharacterized protein involved in exopolysaccharide biosynthesis/Mrp family chromosome partitioning ATPase
MSFERVPAQAVATPLRATREAHPQLPDNPSVALRELISVARRRWITGLGTTIAVTSLAVCYLLTASPLYTATVQMLLDPPGRRTVDNSVTSESFPPDGGVAFAENQLRLLESEGVLRRVVASRQLESDPAFLGERTSLLPASIRSFASALDLVSSEPEAQELQALRKLREAVRTQRLGKGLVIDVSVSSHDRKQSAELANAIAEAYLAEQASVGAETAKQATAAITARLSELREQLRRAEESAQDYKFRNSTITVTGGLVPLPTNEALVGLRELERNIEAARTVYQSFLTRAHQIEVEGTLGGTNARVISQATPPNKRSWPPARLLLGLSLVGGLGLGAGLALARDFLDGRIHTRRQLDASCRHPIISVVPRLKSAATVPRLLQNLAQAGCATTNDIFLRLRDALRTDEPGHASTILLITSSSAGEGKSTIALNLAIAAMLDGERVLLIDADLRERAISRQIAPKVTRLWRRGRPGSDLTGLGDILKDLCTFDASLAFPGKSKLGVLPAGSTDGLGSRVDRSELVGKVLSKAKGFNLIIIDAGSTEADRFVRSLAAVADEIILVVRAGQTRPQDLELATTTLGDAAARIRGVVLNAAE